MGRAQTYKQELVAVISSQGAHLSLSKNTINALAKWGVAADEKSVSALLELVSQPDPHNSLRHALPPRIRDVYADWEDATETDFAQWVANAAICYHQVDEYLNQHSKYHQNNPSNDRVTARFVQGAVHYRRINPDHTSEQIADLAMIAAAAHCAYFKETDRTGKTPKPDINDGLCDHSWCHSVSSLAVIDLATSSHETAVRILDIITEDGIATETHIMYRLDNGPRTLADGVI